MSRRALPFAALLISALFGTGLQAAPSMARASDTAPSGTVTLTRTTATYKPAQIPLSAPEIGNSMRGQYSWLGSESQVPGWPVSDTYFRDQVYWGRLAPQRGNYDFGWIEDGLQRAAEKRGRFGFRVMSYCPGCWMNSRPGFPSVTPAYVPKQPGTDVPDWNSPVFLAAWEELWAALGKKYADDPRLGWVDIGGYGKWGEWHVDPGTPEITSANATRLMRAVLDNLPKTHVVINAMNPRLTTVAMDLSPRIGLRTDCLGEYNMFSLIPTSTTLQQRWKTAPLLSEWCATDATNFVTGAQQVVKYHVSQTSSGNFRTPYSAMSTSQRAGFVDAMKRAGFRDSLTSLTFPRTVRVGRPFAAKSTWSNGGSAPTYDAWDVSMQLRDASGAVVARRPLAINLKTVLPGSKTFSHRPVFTGVKPGKYRLSVVVKDPRAYLDPMALAMTGRQADGSYDLGPLTLAR